MLVSVIVGLYGDFTDACRQICLDLLREAGHSPLLVDVGIDGGSSTPHIELDSLGGLASQLLKAQSNVALAVSWRFDHAFAETLAGAGRSFLLAIDDPKRTVLTLLNQGVDLPNAIRSATSSSACLTDLLKVPHAELLLRDEAVRDPTDIARRCLMSLNLPTQSRDIDAARPIVERYLAKMAPAPADISAELRGRLGDEGALAVEGALAGFWAAFNGRALGPVIATRPLFISEALVPFVSAPIDATGRARCLLLGPFISLPAGNWTLRMVMAFSPELTGTPFTLDVTGNGQGGAKELGRVSFEATVGRYVAQITFNHRDPSRPLEFRLFVDKPTFEGLVSLGYAELQRVEAQIGQDLTSDIDWKSSA